MRFKRRWDFDGGNKRVDLNSLTQDQAVAGAVRQLFDDLVGEDIRPVVEEVMGHVIDTATAEQQARLEDVEAQVTALRTEVGELAAALGRLEAAVPALGRELRSVGDRVAGLQSAVEAQDAALTRVRDTVEAHAQLLDVEAAKEAQGRARAVVAAYLDQARM